MKKNTPKPKNDRPNAVQTNNKPSDLNLYTAMLTATISLMLITDDIKKLDELYTLVKVGLKDVYHQRRDTLESNVSG